jgi:hypothetical protein
MTGTKVIPVLRIFDYKKAIEFYIDWLGFEFSGSTNLNQGCRNIWK